jgi:hypothetical protein
MLTHGISCGFPGIGDHDDRYNFEHMIGIQDSYVFPVKIEDGIAYYVEGDGNWSVDECFPWQAYNKWAIEKLEKELEL